VLSLMLLTVGHGLALFVSIHDWIGLPGVRGAVDGISLWRSRLR
jgi:hypothetical protein